MRKKADGLPNARVHGPPFRPERVPEQERRAAGHWEELSEAVMQAVDVLVIMLLVEAVLLLVSAFYGDIILMIIYAAVMSLAAFAVLYMLLPAIERHARAKERATMTGNEPTGRRPRT